MFNLAERSWPWILLRGIAAVVIGLITLFQPNIALATLAIMLGVWLILDGIGQIINAFTIPLAPGGVRLLFVIFGIISLIAGGIALANMNAALSAVVIIAAVWLFATGIAQIVIAFRIRKVVTGEWTLFVTGVLAIACGVIALVAPATTLAAAAMMFGAFAVVYGISVIGAALRVRSLVKQTEQAAV